MEHPKRRSNDLIIDKAKEMADTLRKDKEEKDGIIFKHLDEMLEIIDSL